MGKKKKISTDGGEALAQNPFANLGVALGELPDAPEKTGAPTGVAEPAPEGALAKAPSSGNKLGNKLVVRRQKKGQGGKTVTVVEGLGLDKPTLDDLARRAKKALGCGARTDGDLLIVAGGQHERVATWLREQGALRVILGN